MQNYKQQFKGKKITVMGLGLLGGASGDILFLAKCGAEITVTDLKSAKELKLSLQKLKNIKNIKYVLGGHKIEDFKKADLILQPGNVPIDSPYLKEARKNKIPIYVSESLFVQYAPKVRVVGVTGTRGKSMTTALIYEVLKQNEKFLKQNVFIGGNVRDVSTLALLEKVKDGDIVIMELDSWALHGMGDIKKSPYISVFTSFMPDHMNYYGSTSLTTSKNAMKRYFEDKANIFKFQKEGDYLIVRPHVRKLINKNIKAHLIVADIMETKGYKFVVPGEHQRENLACAIEVAKLFNIPITRIKNTVKKFKGLEGRLQYIKTIKGVKIYNDNNATTPEATIAGIKALYQEGKEGKIILICGGADKNLDLKLFVNILNTFCKAVIFIPGTGTDKLVSSGKFLVASKQTKDLSEAIKEAIKQSKKGDIILFSPAFASFGQFNNEYERNDLFLKNLKKLK